MHCRPAAYTDEEEQSFTRNPTVHVSLLSISALSLMPRGGWRSMWVMMLNVWAVVLSALNRFDMLPLSKGMSGLLLLSICALLQVCVRRLGTWDHGFRRTIAALLLSMFIFIFACTFSFPFSVPSSFWHEIGHGDCGNAWRLVLWPSLSAHACPHWSYTSSRFAM